MSEFAAVSAAIIAACATTVQQEIANEPPTSVETLSYYPFQVKGYQNSYPRRRVLVLMPLDSRDFKDVAGQTHEPDNGNPAVGVILVPVAASFSASTARRWVRSCRARWCAQPTRPG